MAFVVIVLRKGGVRQRHVFEQDEINVGRVALNNDLQCDAGNVSRNHLRILHRDGRFIVTDLNSANGTYVNGRLIKHATIVQAGDKILIGDWVLQVEEAIEYVATDPVEQGLLDAIAKDGRDDELRQVYGDWLEEQGRTKEAELVAIEIEIHKLDASDELGERRLRSLGLRLANLSNLVPTAWRVLMSRPAIEGCKEVRFSLTCPKRWDGLATTSDPSVRSCNVCEKNVHFARSIGEARSKAKEGLCVAVDVTVARYQGDLEDDERVMMGRMA